MLRVGINIRRSSRIIVSHFIMRNNVYICTSWLIASGPLSLWANAIEIQKTKSGSISLYYRRTFGFVDAQSGSNGSDTIIPKPIYSIFDSWCTSVVDMVGGQSNYVKTS